MAICNKLVILIILSLGTQLCMETKFSKKSQSPQLIVFKESQEHSHCFTDFTNQNLR